MRWLSYQRSKLIAVRVDTFPQMPRGYRIEEFTSVPLPVAIDVDEGVQRLRFATGARCLAAFNEKNACVGVVWIATRTFDEDDSSTRYVLPANAAWDTGLWIPPRYRMGRALSALWAGMAAKLREAGVTWTISRIADYNLASLHAHRRLEPVGLGHIIVVQMAGWQWCSRGAPQWLRVKSGRRSTIDLTFARMNMSIR